MALLTMVDAVRLTGVSRAQLYRYIKAGRLSRTPDGFLDTAELLRAGLMLQMRDETAPVSMTHNETKTPVSRETEPVSGVSSAHIQALERLIAVLQTELDAARAREATLLREAHERETLLLQMLSHVQQQNQRLLDMPRSTRVPMPRPPRATPPPTGADTRTAGDTALARMQALRAQGCSLAEIAATLTQEGFPTRSGKPWHKGTVGYLLQQGT